EIPGTTRDTIEDVIVIDGIKFRFIDTAGIRESTETIERIGISRTLEKIQEADIIIYLYDINTTTEEMLSEDISSIPEGKKLILAANKADQLSSRSQESGVRSEADEITNHKSQITISAKTGTNLESLKEMLVESLDIQKE